MNTYALVSVLDAMELRARIEDGDRDLDGFGLLEISLIDKQQIDLCVHDGEGEQSTIIVNVRDFLTVVRSVISEIEKLKSNANN